MLSFKIKPSTDQTLTPAVAAAAAASDAAPGLAVAWVVSWWNRTKQRIKPSRTIACRDYGPSRQEKHQPHHKHSLETQNFAASELVQVQRGIWLRQLASERQDLAEWGGLCRLKVALETWGFPQLGTVLCQGLVLRESYYLGSILGVPYSRKPQHRNNRAEEHPPRLALFLVFCRRPNMPPLILCPLRAVRMWDAQRG